MAIPAAKMTMGREKYKKKIDQMKRNYAGSKERAIKNYKDAIENPDAQAMYEWAWSFMADLYNGKVTDKLAENWATRYEEWSKKR